MRMVERIEGKANGLRSLLVGVIVLLLAADAVALAAHEGDTRREPSSQLAGAGGGGAEAGTPDASSPSAPATPLPTTAPAQGQPSTSGKGAGAVTTTTAAAPSAGDDPQPSPSGYEYTYDVTLEPSTCVRVGEALTLTMRLKPNAGGVILVVYSDDKYHDKHAGWAGPEGIVKYTWTAPPAPGDALAITQAYDQETEKPGRTDVPFRIVPVGESC